MSDSTHDNRKPLDRPLFGLDFGGTKIEAVVLNGSECAFRHRIKTPDSYQGAIAAISDLVRDAELAVGPIAKVGIGLPGSVSPRNGLMRNANRTYLNGTRFGDDLSRVLRRPVSLSNDANCLALSEAFDGAAANARIVFAVVIGTGVGGGLVVDGKLIQGANGIAGEWGHSPFPSLEGRDRPARSCWCGRSNCVESWVSGTGFTRLYLERTGKALAGEAIISAMRAGDLIAHEMFDLWIDRLARALATVVNLLDPDVIVFGGGMAQISELYARLASAMTQYVFADQWFSRLRPAKWGDASGVRGAARLGM